MANVYQVAQVYSEAVVKGDRDMVEECRRALARLGELNRIQYALEKYGKHAHVAH